MSDIKSYAAQFAAGQPGTSAQDYMDYCRRVVLAKMPLEATSRPSELRQPSAGALIRESDVAALRSHGVVVLSSERVRRATAGSLDVRRLQAELALLHTHGVISPTNSSCNPGAHGVNLRCGTSDERANYAKQRTPHLLLAMDLLRALPDALQQCGYSFRGGAEALAVPGVCLVSAYPAGAHYSRHLDCYGDDNARALTLILYANDEDWRLDRDGGGLALEPVTAAAAGGQAEEEGQAEGQAAAGGQAEEEGQEMVVSPSGGTLVIFESRTVWHAVRPSKKLRYAATLWVYASPVSHQAAGSASAAARAPPAAAPTKTSTKESGGASSDPRAPPPMLALTTDARGSTRWEWG
jgi:hypothetical protein